jgi:hypothetical protein
MRDRSLVPGGVRRAVAVLSLVALGVIATAPSQAAADDCVTVRRPAAGATFTHRFTDAAGTTSTSTIEYLAVSDTSVRLRLVYQGAYGTVETVNESTLRVEDDLFVVDTMVSSGTNARGAFQNTATLATDGSSRCRSR